MRRWILFLIAYTCYGQWPTPKSAMDAYEFAQARRAEAEKLWSKGDAAGLRILEDTLKYLDQPLVRDLAAGMTYLDMRRSNIYLDYAEAYGIQGNVKESLRYLQKYADLRPHPGVLKALEGEKHFDAVRADPGYAAIVAKLRLYEKYWDSTTLKTAYRDNLPDAEKIAGLSKFWSEVKYNFGYPEKLVALDWDKVYLDAIPTVLATKSTGEYYREMQRLCARLGDGHTNVFGPDNLGEGRPPIRAALVEGRVIVMDPRAPALEDEGIVAGVEVVAVDGVPVQEYAAREVAPFQSAATPQDRDNRTYWYGFLRGPAAGTVRLKLRDASGKEFERTINRRGYSNLRRVLPFEVRMLPGNVAHVILNDFSVNDVVKQWKEAFPRLSTASALVLDVRLNGGGSSNIGYAVLRDLIDRPVRTSRQVMRRYNPTERAWGEILDWAEVPAGDLTPNDGPHYKGPVAVLSGAATYSAAEDFLVAWKASGRGKIFGEASGGSTGQPLFFELPGGGSARVCTKRDTYADGSEWVGKGIEPDVLVRPTVADVRAGRDTVLERALEFLKSSR